MSHVKKRLALAAGANGLIVLFEEFAGLKAKSLSLVVDGIHNASDELALVCLYLAFFLPVTMSKHAQRVANVLNSLGLVTVCGLLVWRSVVRIISPVDSNPIAAMIGGVLAALLNWIVARVLFSVRDQNPAIRLAYLHNLGDVYVSFVPVAAGVAILLTNFGIFDPLFAMGIAIWISWTTLKEIASSKDELLWPEHAICRHDNELAL